MFHTNAVSVIYFCYAHKFKLTLGMAPVLAFYYTPPFVSLSVATLFLCRGICSWWYSTVYQRLPALKPNISHDFCSNYNSWLNFHQKRHLLSSSFWRLCVLEATSDHWPPAKVNRVSRMTSWLQLRRSTQRSPLGRGWQQESLVSLKTYFIAKDKLDSKHLQ